VKPPLWPKIESVKCRNPKVVWGPRF